MLTRADIVARSKIRPDRSIYYSQENMAPDGYRADCSGYLSLCWNIPGGWGGQSTVTLVSGGFMRQISKAELQPGDAIGICGASTGGDFGHIVLFLGWTDSTRYYGAEQRGGCYGPEHRVIQYPYDGMSADWRCWRLNGVSEDVTSPTPVPSLEKLVFLIRFKPSPSVFLSDGITARPISSEAELADIITLHKDGSIKLGNNGNVRVVTRKSLIGRIVGPPIGGFEELAL